MVRSGKILNTILIKFAYIKITLINGQNIYEDMVRSGKILNIFYKKINFL